MQSPAAAGEKGERLTETPRIVARWMQAEGLTNSSCFEWPERSRKAFGHLSTAPANRG